MKYQLENCFVNIQNNTEYLDVIQKALSGKNKVTFFYLNSYSFYLANKNENFKNAFNKADFIIADGYSIVWMLKTINKIKIEKVVFTYAFFEYFSKLFLYQNTKLFLLGGSQNVIENSAKILKIKFNLNIVGFSNGYFKNGEQANKVLNNIESTAPDVLICGMGMPQSEIWIQGNKGNIKAKVIFSVGGFFDFLTHKNKMAPKWMYNSGLEWLFRLFQEPERLFKRYTKVNLYFLFTMIKRLSKKNNLS